jgi:hypothetical protein
MESPSLSIVGFPARFAKERSAFSTVLSHTPSSPRPGNTYILQGVDASCSISAGKVDAWISLGSPGNKCIFWAELPDPATRGLWACGSWRGNLPWYNTDTLEVGVESFLPTDLAIDAWGIWVPMSLLVDL